MLSSGSSNRVDLVLNDVSEECIAYIIRVRRTCEVGTTLGVSNMRRALRRSIIYSRFLSPC
jgi:hypothetical protein